MKPTQRGIDYYREQIERINFELLELLNRRAQLVEELNSVKTEHGVPVFCPDREQEMLERLTSRNRGPFTNSTIKALFKEIFKASANLVRQHEQRKLLISREYREESVVVDIRGNMLGETPVLMAGPCSVESKDQMMEAARIVHEAGGTILRGGAFKPRTSPYSFQGLGVDGLKLLHEAAQSFGLSTISEVMDVRFVDVTAQYVDILQIGARNMYNYDLLREVGKSNKPVMLKRGLSATLDEFMLAAEYIFKEGNENVILCERGIRTYETQTRNTLDIAAVPLLKRMTRLPVIVDVSHAAGRKDILIPLAMAALAAGADGIMVEMHPNPEVALSDAKQQLDPQEFMEFVARTGLGKGSLSVLADSQKKAV